MEHGSMGDDGWEADFTMYDTEKDPNESIIVTRQAFIWGNKKNGQQQYDSLSIYNPYYDGPFDLRSECVKVK